MFPGFGVNFSVRCHVVGKRRRTGCVVSETQLRQLRGLDDTTYGSASDIFVSHHIDNTDGIETHKTPVLNIKHTPVFFRHFICNCHIIVMGTTARAKSRNA